MAGSFDAGVSCQTMNPPATVLVVSIPGLSRSLLPAIPPGTRLGGLASGRGRRCIDLRPSWPAVTCSVQATLTTGLPPAVHGIVANGLPMYRLPVEADLTDPGNHTAYRRSVSFWEQSNQLLDAPRFWQRLPNRLSTLMVCFQQTMPGFRGPPCPAADLVVTPKPEHSPDGRITSLIWTDPPTLATELQGRFGPFPLQHYWGPAAGIASSRWIAAASALLLQTRRPQLAWVYLPHLDYDLQRYGPDDPRIGSAVAQLADAAEPLLAAAEAEGYSTVVLSEYAMTTVHTSVAPNRLLRRAGLLRLVGGGEGPSIDYRGSDAWAMCDHQTAHVYCRSAAACERARQVLIDDGCLEARVRLEPAATPVAHPRAGDLQVQAPPGVWLDYRWWWPDEADRRDIVPDWATTVDIHRKPGYDPLELFAGDQPRRITTDATLVRGSHGRTDTCGVVLAPAAAALPADELPAAQVAGLITELLGATTASSRI